MSDTPNKFYLTTPIYYVNARPHIGHAYTTIAADVIARRHRLLGDDTYFLTGTDEHGQKIQRSAEASGIPPQQFADEVSASFQSLWKRMGITNDAFIRTTDEAHKKGAQKLFREIYENGKHLENPYIYLSTYTGAYCVSDEAFVDAAVGTPCPDCGKLLEEVTEENFFFRLSSFQEKLIDRIESGEILITPDFAKNEVLTFVSGIPRSALPIDDPNLATEDTHRGIRQSAKLSGFSYLENSGEVKRTANGHYYIPGALKDLSISRSSFTWGIPVPEDILAKENAKEKHVIYVWLDALANYMTALGYGSDDESLFQKFWPADLHLVGKEITRFHCVYWPAFLLAASLPLPKQVTANGWLLFDNSKMSKSKGNVVRTETILDAFGTLLPKPTEAESLEVDSLVKGTASAVPQESTEGAALAAEVRLPSLSAEAWKQEQDLFASDILRYFLLREIPFGKDGSFSFDALVQRYNSDLANGYGNLVSRTLSMIQKYSDSSIPTPIDLSPGRPQHADQYFFSFVSGPGKMAYANEVEKKHYQLRFSAGPLELGVHQAFEHFDLTRTAENPMWAVSGTDSYLSINAPWKMAAGVERDDVLYVAAESIRIITALLYPILPYATAKVWKQLGFEKSIEQAAADGELKNLQWGGLKPGTKLGPLAPIFPRAPKELIQLMNDMEASNAQKPEGIKSVEPSKSVVKNAGLPLINNNNDASPHHRTEFAESPISSVSATAALNPIAETLHPITAHHPEEAEPRPETPQIAIDDFIKIDLRVAQIVVAERILKADKLLRLEVDLGYERRQILSGIAQWYTPEELIGRRIVVIANLAPRKMRGLESHGMLLAASQGDDGKPVLATFGEDIALGSRLK